MADNGVDAGADNGDDVGADKNMNLILHAIVKDKKLYKKE